MNTDKEIIKFCQLVEFVNIKNAYLQKANADFYYGGYSFEDCYSTDIEALNKSCNEIKEIIRKIG